ncbi:MAG: MBL fold metallo-hydrolase [Patescibacteria group bacterium]
MKIIWHGQSCFQIINQVGKNEKISIVIDPFDSEVGLKLPKLEADILLITHDHHDHNNSKAVSGDPFIITGPGEYETKGIFIQGIPAFHDDVSGNERGKITMYNINVEDILICHLSDLGQKELTTEQVDMINGVDILMIPVGGTYTIDTKEALKIMSQLEPKITIPMHYSLPGMKTKLASLSEFQKTLGLGSVAPIDSLTIKKKDFSEEEAKIIVLKP